MYPGAIPSYAGFTSSHTLAADNHAAQSNAGQADIIALATKLGTGASTPVSGLLLRGNGAGTSAWAQVGLTTDVTGVLPQANGGTGGASASAAAANLAAEVGKLLFPIGCIYTDTTGTNPGTSLGFGTWIAFGGGRVLVGGGTSDQSFAAGATGGESNHTLTTAELASHAHSHKHTWQGQANTTRFLTPDVNNGTAASTGGATWGALSMDADATTAGSGSSHNNLQPYIVVYFWKRVS